MEESSLTYLIVEPLMTESCNGRHTLKAEAPNFITRATL